MSNYFFQCTIVCLCVLVLVCRFLDELTLNRCSGAELLWPLRASWLIEFPGYNNYIMLLEFPGYNYYIMLPLPVTLNLIGANNELNHYRKGNDCFKILLCMLVRLSVCLCLCAASLMSSLNRCSQTGLLGLLRASWLIEFP